MGSGNGGPSIRQKPGVATGGAGLVYVGETDKFFRGTELNASKIPAQIADKLRGREFKNWDDFRKSFWKEVAKDDILKGRFGNKDLGNMLNGLAPRASEHQWYGGCTSYVLHHDNPVHRGGGLYDLTNIHIVTPKYHSQVLPKEIHYGIKKKK